MGMVYAFPLHAALNLHLLAADASAAAASLAGQHGVCLTPF